MPVSQISQEHFDSLDLPESCRGLWSRTQETEWYADVTGTVLGVVLFNEITSYWGYVMCARRADGEWKRLGIGSDFTSLVRARNDLIASIERHLSAAPPT